MLHVTIWGQTRSEGGPVVDYKAEVEENPAAYATAETAEAALGKLMLTWPELFPDVAVTR